MRRATDPSARKRGSGVVDLDAPAGAAEAAMGTDCSCGARRTLMRHYALSPRAGRALSRLKAAHRDEYERYLAEERAEALAEFEAAWGRHLAGEHHPYRVPEC
jgi:hypothetical protein